MERARLVLADGPQAGVEYVIDTLVTVGRARTNTIVTADPLASRLHAEIKDEYGRCTLHDRSSNGTRVNRRRIGGPVVLRDGDRIEVPGITLIFRSSDRTLTAPARRRRADELLIERDAGRVWVSGRNVHLSVKELAVLLALDARRGVTVSKNEIAIEAWPEYAGGVDDYNVEQQIRALREKLEKDPHRPTWIITDHGRGYRLAR